jgi:aminopeptidase N
MIGKFSIFFGLTLCCLLKFGNSNGNILNYANSEETRDRYNVLFYGFDLNVSDSSTYLSGSVSILLKSTVSQLQQVVLDFADELKTDSVMVNDSHSTYTHTLDELIVQLDQPLALGKKIMITVYYHGLGKNSGVSSGIYNKYVSEWNKQVTWTLSEPFSAKDWFPCKQVLNDKADSVYIFLSTDNRLKAGSNGLLTAEVPLPDNRVRYEWKSRYPIAYYLISFTVGDYMDYSFYLKDKTENDSLLIQNYIYNDSAYLTQNKAAIDNTADLISLFSDLYGNYPFSKEKYGHCVAPFGGGMEHQTMTTLVNFSFLLVAHELAHQWFGDDVTCATWQDIWINEGFASYSEYLAYQYLKSQDVANSWITNCHAYIKSEPNGSIYVPADDALDEDRVFDYRLSYRKGAAIIHMLRHEIDNDKVFFGALTGFLEHFRHSNATGADFRDYLETYTGMELDVFFDQWYYGEGYPIHHITWHHRNDTLYINSLQTVSSKTPFFNVLLEFKVSLNNSDTLISLRQTDSFNTWQVYLPGVVNAIEADPHQWLIYELASLTNVKPEGSTTFIKIAPNPVREKVIVEFATSPTDNYTMYLAGSTGRIITIKKQTGRREVIDVDGYPSGIYFIILSNNHTTHIGKFIIN